MARAFKRFGLATPSQVPRDVTKPGPVPTLASADAKKFGMENFCNNCYANSVIQALYFCTPFRDLMLQSPDASISTPPPPVAGPTPPAAPTLAPIRRKPERKQSTPTVPTTSDPSLPPVTPIPPSPPTLFSALRSLFLFISTHPQQSGTVSPRAFIEKLKESNRIFDTLTHQDAHEFLNYLLNQIVEEVEAERKAAEAPTEDLSNSVTTLQSKPSTIDSSSGYPSQNATLVHKLFEGVLTSETRCLTCETVSSRDESFLDLSIDIEQNSSVTACLRQFSASEMLCQKNKFFCDSCCDLQEAEKRMKIKRLPNVLALHLKRFKYQEDLGRHVKLAYRVAFPFELRLFNTVDDMDDADRLYNLFGIVVHIGNGPHHGHYVSLIKTLGTWLLFDDENVSTVAESDIPKYFGDSTPAAGCAYVLYYQAADIDTTKLGLRPQPAVEESTSTTATTTSSTSNPLEVPKRPPGLAEAGLPTMIPVEVQSSISSSSPPSSSLPTVSTPPSSTQSNLQSQSPLGSHSPPPPPGAALATPPTAAPLLSSFSSPPSTTAASSPLNPTSTSTSSKVGGLFGMKTIRRSPSISVRTSVSPASSASAPLSAGATTPTAALSSIFSAAGLYGNSSTGKDGKEVPVPVPPIPQTPTRTGVVNGVTHPSSRQQPQVIGGSNGTAPAPDVNGSPAPYGKSSGLLPPLPGTPRALPVPPAKPVTSGEGDKDKDKEGKWGKKWFGGASTGRNASSGQEGAGNMSGGEDKSDGLEGVATEGESSPVNGIGGVNGVGSGKKEKEHKDKSNHKDGHKEKDKDKSSKGNGGGPGAFFLKRKSFRLGEKALKTLVQGSSPDSDASPSSPLAPRDDNSSLLRSSLQLPQRRGSESSDWGQAQAPPVMASMSTPGPAGDYDHPTRTSTYKIPRRLPRPLSTNLKQQPQEQKQAQHLHPGYANGNVSPAPSSSSSFDSTSLGVPLTHSTSVAPLPPPPVPRPGSRGTTGSTASTHHSNSSPLHNPPPHPPPSHPLPRPPSLNAVTANTNGRASLPPPPRILASHSMPMPVPVPVPVPAPVPSPPTSASVVLAPPPEFTGPLTPLRAPMPPPLPPPLASLSAPERKKSLVNLPVFRGRDKEKGKESRERERDGAGLKRPATSGQEGMAWRTQEPLPPMPGRPTTTGGGQSERPTHHRQSSTTSSFGTGLKSGFDEDSPGLGSFGVENVSGTSNGSGAGVVGNGNGISNGGFKRATRKLSLSAPMLGFRKRDK